VAVVFAERIAVAGVDGIVEATGVDPLPLAHPAANRAIAAATASSIACGRMDPQGVSCR
jgi:hypothetical protein